MKNSRRRSIVKDEVQCRYPQIAEHRTRGTHTLHETTKVVLKLSYLWIFSKSLAPTYVFKLTFYNFER